MMSCLNILFGSLAVSMRFSYPLSKVNESRKSYSQFPWVCKQHWEHRGICVCSCSLDKTRIDAGNGQFFLLVWNSASGCLQILLFAKSPDPYNREWNSTLDMNPRLYTNRPSGTLCKEKAIYIMIYMSIIVVVSQAGLLSDPI